MHKIEINAPVNDRDPYTHCVSAQSQKRHRITCSVQSKRNDYAKPKLNLSITADGLYYWCKCCRTEHYLSHEELGRIRDELVAERTGEHQKRSLVVQKIEEE